MTAVETTTKPVVATSPAKILLNVMLFTPPVVSSVVQARTEGATRDTKVSSCGIQCSTESLAGQSLILIIVNSMYHTISLLWKLI